MMYPDMDSFLCLAFNPRVILILTKLHQQVGGSTGQILTVVLSLKKNQSGISAVMGPGFPVCILTNHGEHEPIK